MDKSSKIFVAGHRGLVGSAMVRSLTKGHANLLLRTHAELDLTDQAAVARFFEQERPDYVFLAAAKVGGIHANNSYPGDFIYSNLAIQINVIEAARRYGVQRLLFLGSSCIYPRDCPQPMREEHLLSGALEQTNRAYAVAKISGIEMCGSYNRQYGTHFLAAMPTVWSQRQLRSAEQSCAAGPDPQVSRGQSSRRSRHDRLGHRFAEAGIRL